MGGLCKWVFHNFVKLIDYQAKLPKVPTDAERAAGNNSPVEDAHDRKTRLNRNLRSMNDVHLFDIDGNKARKFNGSLESLAGFTCDEVIAIVPRLVAVVGIENQNYITQKHTDVLRKILVILHRVIMFEKKLDWNAAKINELHYSMQELGPLLREFTDVFTGEAGSNSNIIIKAHNPLHWPKAIVRFGSPKVWNSAVFEAEHKSYKLAYKRTKRAKGGAGVDSSIFKYSVLSRFVEHVFSIVSQLREKREDIESVELFSSTGDISSMSSSKSVMVKAGSELLSSPLTWQRYLSEDLKEDSVTSTFLIKETQRITGATPDDMQTLRVHKAASLVRPTVFRKTKPFRIDADCSAYNTTVVYSDTSGT